MENIPHGIQIGGQMTTVTGTDQFATALDTEGNIPVWDVSPSKVDATFHFTVKKKFLRLRTIQCRVRIYMSGTMILSVYRGSEEHPIETASVDVTGHYLDNDICAEFGNVVLEPGTEYRLYVKSSNKFYYPPTEPEWMVENDYLEFSKDDTPLFAAAVTVDEVEAGYLHTWRDLHLIPVCRPIVQPPLEKTMMLDIEGMSGEADLSHGLTGYPIFKDREGSWQFWLDTDSCQEEAGFFGPVGDRAFRELQAKLNALMAAPYQTKIILDDEPDFYYLGRVWADGKPTYQYDHAKITLSYRLYPYKYLRNTYGEDWLWDSFCFNTDFADIRTSGSGLWNWDSFCFETDLATPKLKNVALKAGQTQSFPLVFTDKPSAVFVTSTGNAEASMTVQNGEAFKMVREHAYMTCYTETGTKTYQKSTVHIPFQVHEKEITLNAIEFDCKMTASGTPTISLALYEKGNDVAIASGTYTGTTDDTNAVRDARIGMSAKLEPEGNYILVMTSATTFYAYCAQGEEDLAKNDYFDMQLSEDVITVSDRNWYPILNGTLEFFIGQGAVLSPNEKTNIGTVGRGLDDSGMSVTVTAQEDTVVDIDYCPAYL